MIFSEPRFLLFFLLVFSVHWALRSNAARKHVLLAASLYFYGSWDARFLALIVAASLCDWFCSLRIAAARARGAQPRRWLMVSLCYNLGTLGFFKYFNFFADSAVAFLQWLGLPASPSRSSRSSSRGRSCARRPSCRNSTSPAGSATSTCSAPSGSSCRASSRSRSSPT
jgi:hypothetical protein